MSELFGASFKDLLRAVLRRGRRLRVRRDENAPAHRTSFAQSGSFAGHRAYSSGEDLRYIDWNAYARTGDLFLKVLEEDERRALTILLDCSPSMTAGLPPRFDGARRLAAILGGLALARLGVIRLVTGGEDRWTFDGPSGLPRLLRVLESLEPGDATPTDAALVPLERGFYGTVVWLSDFATPDAFVDALRIVKTRRRHLIGVLPATAEDRLPPVDGWMWLRDPETGRAERVFVDLQLRAAMERELAQLRRHQDAVFAASGVRLVRFPVPEPGDFRVASWLPGEWIHSA